MILRLMKDGKEIQIPPGAKIILTLGAAKPKLPPMPRIRRLATPKWANLDKIKAIYADCQRVSRETGIKHHVDHVIPIKGRIVCGLHVHENLRIITAAENRQKTNKFEVSQ